MLHGPAEHTASLPCPALRCRCPSPGCWAPPDPCWSSSCGPRSGDRRAWRQRGGTPAGANLASSFPSTCQASARRLQPCAAPGPHGCGPLQPPCPPVHVYGSAGRARRTAAGAPGEWSGNPPSGAPWCTRAAEHQELTVVLYSYNDWAPNEELGRTSLALRELQPGREQKLVLKLRSTGKAGARRAQAGCGAPDVNPGWLCRPA